MNTYNSRTDVALILWNEDVIQLVSLVLLHHHLKSSGIEPGEGADRIENLIVSRRPRVVVFDLDPPYDRSAAVARYLLNRFPDCGFVMTSADSARARRTAPWLVGHPMFQKPYEMDEIANTICLMVRRRSISITDDVEGVKAWERTPWLWSRPIRSVFLPTRQPEQQARNAKH